MEDFTKALNDHMRALILLGTLSATASACFVPPDAEEDASTGATDAAAASQSASSSAETSSPTMTGGPSAGSGVAPRGGEMAEIPGGTFPMGCDPANDATCVDDPPHPHVLTERPVHEVTLSAYRIDVNEVTLGHYLECVDDGGCTPPGENWAECNALSDDHDDHPVDCVTWEQGAAFCSWAGKRLPTEAEWEYAARGDDERIYPWGNEAPDCSRANLHFNGAAGCGTVDTYAVGSLPAGDSPFGVHDMCGNVAEFVADAFSEDYYAMSPAQDPQGPEAGDAQVMRGGGYNYPVDPWIMRASSRTSYDSSVPSPQIGFRCAKSEG